MTTGDVNTFIGYQAAGDGIVTGARNVAVGGNSGLNLTSGGDNTLIGNNAGDALTTGNDNVIIGYLAGAHDINLTTGARNVLVGAYVDAATTGQTDSIVIGYNVIGAGDYTTLGVNTSDIRAQHGVATWAAVSDERYKKDIVDRIATLEG
jgi:trimeric autotransporter adhesin